jgi:hypothetical protein
MLKSHLFMLIVLKVGTRYSHRKKVLEKLRVDIRHKRRKEKEYRNNQDKKMTPALLFPNRSRRSVMQQQR